MSGQTLSLPRSAGDVLYPSNLGGEKLALEPGERARWVYEVRCRARGRFVVRLGSE